MAKLFAQKIILGKITFEDVPTKLKEEVAKIFIEECDMPELVTNKEYLPKEEAVQK